MAQYALPISDSTNDGWTQGAGDGDGSFFDELDEGFGAGRGTGAGPDDATTYWASPTNPSNDVLQTNLSSVTDPGVDTGHSFTSRTRKSAAAGKQMDVATRLVHSGGYYLLSSSNIDEVWTTRTLSISDASGIVDYTTLQGYAEAQSVGGGAARAAWESAHEFECPDAAMNFAVPEMFGGMPPLPPIMTLPY